MIKANEITKKYGCLTAIDKVSFEIKKGEIFALLGPNGAGKSTLISIICSTVNKSFGTITIKDFDIIKDYRKARSLIGLVPQELTTDMFETVLHTVTYSRGLFGKAKNPQYIEKTWREAQYMEYLSIRIYPIEE